MHTHTYVFMCIILIALHLGGHFVYTVISYSISNFGSYYKNKKLRNNICVKLPSVAVICTHTRTHKCIVFIRNCTCLRETTKSDCLLYFFFSYKRTNVTTQNDTHDKYYFYILRKMLLLFVLLLLR